MNLRQKENLRTNINRIGYYQIIGGICGIIITFYGIYLSLPFSGFTAWLLVLSMVLYLFSIFCGQLLIKGKYLLGLKLSAINQALQISGFAMFGFAFSYVSGLCLGFNIDYTDNLYLGLNLSLSTFKININSSEELLVFSFNFVAVFMLQFILNIKSELETKPE
jgi:hypothetical protein